METGNTQGILKYSFNEPTDDPIEVGASNQPYSDKSEEVETSSDEPYGNQNTKIKNLKRQIHHLAEMNVLTFNTLSNLSKNLLLKWVLLWNICLQLMNMVK